MAEKCWLSFSLGPVQSFISTARTVRDLWTGSYLLSWLTAHAANAVQNNERFLEPNFEVNDLFKFVRSKGEEKPKDFERLLIPTIPNRFIVEVDAMQDDTVKKQIKQAVTKEWNNISEAVHSCLKEKWDKDYAGWDEQWNEQIENCWDIQIVVLPTDKDEVDIKKAELLGFKREEAVSVKDAAFKARMFLLSQLIAAQKQIRYYPPHEKNDCHRPKCALCGERSQQIPYGISPKQWKKAAKATAERGERLQTKNRFCAVELVKRFAWAQYFSKERFKCETQERRVWDTYTIAAFSWLKKLLPEEKNVFKWVSERDEEAREWNKNHGCEKNQNWNGAWLSRNDEKIPDEDEYDPCPPPVLKRIEELRLSLKKKNFSESPPSYYAILMLDGDNMGEKLLSANEEKRKEISRKLASFAMNNVPKIVEKHLGQLIYAGGDDVLAMLPCETAVICSRDISSTFSGLLPGFTLSGGIAVVHVKHNLQGALDIARKTEKEAKNAGRDRLAISIVKRSGSPETAVIGWNQIEKFNDLLRKFSDEKASDRWLYQFAEKWGTLEQDFQMLDCEFYRLLNRSDKAPKEEAKSFWDTMAKEPIEERRNALMLMQHASFLARSKKGD